MPTSNGIETTLRTLLRSNNRAASDLLAKALVSEERALRLGAVRTLARRDDRAGHRTLVEGYARLPEEARGALAETPHRAPLSASLAEMIVPANPRLARRAAEVARDWEATLVLPAIAEAVLWAPEDDRSFYAEETLRLSCRLEAAMKQYASVTDASKKGEQEDPVFQRRAAVNALAEGVQRFDTHRSAPIVDAFLRLAPSDEPALVEALRNPQHVAHDCLLEMLRHSRSEGALNVLAAVLLDLHAPERLLLVATERSDREGLAILLGRLGSPLGARARAAVARVPGFAWLEADRLAVLTELPESAQATAIQLAAASGASRKLLAAAIESLLQHGEPAGRLAAVEAIASLKDRLAHTPLSAALLRAEPAVLPAVARLLRAKNYPDAIAILTLLLEHEDEPVVQAAQHALSEVTLAQFRDQLQDLPPEQRRRLGRLIAKADPNAVATLESELRAGAAQRRLRTLDLIELMGVVGRVTEPLLKLVAEDRDAGVRAEAATLLGSGRKLPSVLEGLEAALGDRSGSVRSAAQASLERLIGQPLIPIDSA